MSRLKAAALVAVVAALPLACATPQAASAAPSSSSSATAQAAPAGEDVAVLKERVSRLERRINDVDNKLALLLAQRTSPPRRPQPELGPRELIQDDSGPNAAPKEEASLGARAIDIGSRRSVYEDPPEPVIKADEDNSGPPIVIKVTGDAPRDAVVSEPPSPRRRSGSSEAVKSDGIDFETSSGLPVKERYEEAQSHVKNGEYLEAIAIFEDISGRHPKHDLADNSVYWAGFCHQARGDHKLAVSVWEKLPIKYPKSAKVPDALFGMAVSEEALGEPAVAETLYEQLVAQYPRADKAKDAKKALSRLRPK
jgi:tol-pal system protein YbgF